MRRLDRDAVDARAALNKLPPLIKGYLRLGGFVGDGAVIDAEFNTTDVAVVVQTDLVTDKYYKHYERDTPLTSGAMLPSLTDRLASAARLAGRSGRVPGRRRFGPGAAAALCAARAAASASRRCCA